MILDEAHQLPDTATLFFGETLTAGQLAELARDAELEGLKTARDYTPLPEAAQGLTQAVAPSTARAPARRSGNGRRPKRCATAGFAAALDALASVARSAGGRAGESGGAQRRARALCATRDGRRRSPGALARRRARRRCGEWIRWLDVTLARLAACTPRRCRSRRSSRVRSRTARARGSSPRPRSRSAAISRSISASSV